MPHFAIALIFAGSFFLTGVLASAREAHNSDLAKAYHSDASRVPFEDSIAYRYKLEARKNETRASYWNSLAVVAAIGIAISLAFFVTAVI